MRNVEERRLQINCGVDRRFEVEGEENVVNVLWWETTSKFRLP